MRAKKKVRILQTPFCLPITGKVKWQCYEKERMIKRVTPLPVPVTFLQHWRKLAIYPQIFPLYMEKQNGSCLHVSISICLDLFAENWKVLTFTEMFVRILDLNKCPLSPRCWKLVQTFSFQIVLPCLLSDHCSFPHSIMRQFVVWSEIIVLLKVACCN